MVKSARSNRLSDLLFFGIFAAILLLLNISAGLFFYRFDLTEENRFSLSESTKKVLTDLESPVYFEVFLEGELPNDFKRLRQSIQETLEEFRVYAGNNLQYEFRNPSESSNSAQTREVYKHLLDRGINPTTLYINEGDQRVEKLVFPGAVVSYLTNEMPVTFLSGDPSLPPQVQLNQSIENLEFALINTIKKLSTRSRKKIAILQGHGEMSPLEGADFISTISETYDVRRIRLQSAANGDFEGIVNLDEFDLLICADPDSAFSDQNKFKLDQYIVKGGKAIFLIDQMIANIDSIGTNGSISVAKTFGLRDLFFKMGFRLNPNLVQDQFSAAIPLVVGYMGDRPQYQMMKWPFYPILNEFGQHPISRNSQPLYSRFISTIDTVKSKGIKKTVLVTTSDMTRILPSPVRLDFNEVRKPAKKELFNKGPQIVGLLLEGAFNSLYTGRVTAQTEEAFGFKAEGINTKVIVFSDGDLIKNEINNKDNSPYPLGYDRFSKITFGNKSFLINAVDYLLDESGVMEARNKLVILRPLDPKKVEAQGPGLKVFNIAFPLISILILGIILHLIRRRRFEKTEI